MINLSYRFDQDSCSLEVAGIPDVSSGDSEDIIGILSSWKLRIIGLPLLEGEKEHLDNLMQVVLDYSRSYISGTRTTIVSNRKIVTMSPSGVMHKLLLKSTKTGVKPLEIILDDSELSDLTRCLDRLRFDNRFNIRWEINHEKPFNRKYISTYLEKSKNYSHFIYALIIFLFTSTLLVFIPTNSKYELKEITNSSQVISQ